LFWAMFESDNKDMIGNDSSISESPIIRKGEV